MGEAQFVLSNTPCGRSVERPRSNGGPCGKANPGGQDVELPVAGGRGQWLVGVMAVAGAVAVMACGWRPAAGGCGRWP